MIVEREGLVEDGKIQFKDVVKDTELIKAGLERISRSMVTMAIIPELESSPSSNYEDWASIKIRMVESTDAKLPTKPKDNGEYYQWNHGWGRKRRWWRV